MVFTVVYTLFQMFTCVCCLIIRVDYEYSPSLVGAMCYIMVTAEMAQLVCCSPRRNG